MHGGGREIDAETARRGVPKQAVEGLRITDAATLDAVIAVLAGTINTRLVAALVGERRAGGRADRRRRAASACRRARRRIKTVDGHLVDLGLVGQPSADGRRRWCSICCRTGYVPAIACLGVEPNGQVLNVNADTLAAALAAALPRRAARSSPAAPPACSTRPARRSTTLDVDGIDRMIADGTASAGMVAKLRACRDALDAGVDSKSRSSRPRRRRVCSPRPARASDSSRARVGRCFDDSAARGCQRRRTERVMDTVPNMTKTSDIQALEAQHVLQTYKRMPVALVRGSGVASVRRRGPRVPRLAVGHRRRRAGSRAPGAGRRARRSGARRSSHTSNLFFHPLQGQLADEARRRRRASRARSSATAARKPTRRA